LGRFKDYLRSSNVSVPSPGDVLWDLAGQAGKIMEFQSPVLGMSFGTIYLAKGSASWVFQSLVPGMSFGTFRKRKNESYFCFSPQFWGCPLGQEAPSIQSRFVSVPNSGDVLWDSMAASLGVGSNRFSPQSWGCPLGLFL